MTQPLVTVLLNSYNRPRLIRDALDSILAQTWPNIQLIICDDYSNAETLAVIESYRSCLQDWPEKPAHYRGWCKCEEGMFGVVKPPKEPTSHERQYGQRCSVCINAGMRYATGDFVCFLPDDDFLTPRSIELRAQYLVNNPEVNAVYGRLEACHASKPVPEIHWMGPSTAWVAKDGYGVGQFGMISNYTFGTGTGFPCVHDRYGFWSAEPIARAANKVDHGMMMVRRVPNLPEWPEYRTAILDLTPEGDDVYEIPASDEVILSGGSTCTDLDCPDAGFFFRCELAGLGPFHSVDEVVVVKRYHEMHHRTDPSRRE